MVERRNRIATLVIGMLLTGAVTAQDFPATPPTGGAPKDFNLPATESFELDNGMAVTLAPYGAIPKVTVSARVMVGNLNDGDHTWLSDLTADLMEEGTTSRDAEAVARAAARMGGEVGIAVGMDQTAITGDALAEFAPEMVRLVADVVRTPALPEDELERLRRDALRNVDVARNDPGQMGLNAFRKALYGDHPYGRMLPTAEQLESYTIEQVRAFHENNFGARRTHLYVAGMFDKEAVREAVEQAFGDWKAGPEPLRLPPTPATGRQYVDMINRANASQSNVYLGLPTIDPSHPDFVGLNVTNALLGGSFSSRITSNIREDKGYTYSPFSQLSTRRSDGYWVQQAAITTDDTAPALKEVFHEINRLRDEPPSEEELDAIQSYLAGIFTLQNSTRQGIINQLNQVDLHGLDQDYLTRYVSRIHALEPADVSRLATEYLRPEDMTLVVVGDRGRIGESLAEFLEPGGERQQDD